MLGNFAGYMYLNRHYGNGAPVPFANFRIIGQAGTFVGNNAAAGLNAPLWALERFNPNSLNDVHKWIPEGLPYDLMDDRNDNNNPFGMIDNVSGFTINQSFNALQSDVKSIPAFRNRLLLNSGNNQQGEVNQLFLRYGY